jgi:DNA-binding transcriptional ArsR family regulator
MLTDVNAMVDALNGAPATPRTVMWSIQQIAERDGVSKQAVSKQVARLVERHGLNVERDSQGRVTAVNVAEYDHLRGRFGDPSKAQAPKPAAGVLDTPAVASSESYEEALRQKTWHEAEQKKLALALTKREQIPIADLDDAVVPLSDALVGTFEDLVSRADEIATALTRGGLQHLRATLKKIAADQRRRAAEALEQLLAEVGRPNDEATRQ